MYWSARGRYHRSRVQTTGCHRMLSAGVMQPVFHSRSSEVRWTDNCTRSECETQRPNVNRKATCSKFHHGTHWHFEIKFYLTKRRFSFLAPPRDIYGFVRYLRTNPHEKKVSSSIPTASQDIARFSVIVVL